MIQIGNHRRFLALQMGQSKLLDETREIQDFILTSFEKLLKQSSSRQ